MNNKGLRNIQEPGTIHGRWMSEKYEIIYYCFEYYCHHGARTHARSFFTALSQHPLVSKAVLFPVREEKESDVIATVGQFSSIRSIGRDSVKFIWRNCVPKFVRMQIDMYRPRRYLSFKRAIEKEKPHAVVLRIGNSFRMIQKLRRAFPNLIICIEFNSTGFDEIASWVPARLIWRREEARQFGFADSIFVVSEYLKRYLLSLNPALRGRIFVNPNGVDPEMFKPLGQEARVQSRNELGIPEDAMVLGYVGGMETFRRLPEAVCQVAALRRSGLNRLFLVIIGTGHDSDRVADAIAGCEEDLRGWIYASNRWVAHEDIPYLMAAFDVGFFPYSNPYGSPLKITEYLSCGLPVIGPDTPGVTEQIDRKHLPYLVKQDGSNFAEVVRHVHHNLETCKAAAIGSRMIVQRELTWATNAARVVKAIHSVSDLVER